MHTILSEAKDLSGYLHTLYCQLHRHPELGRQEHQTQALILAELQKMNIEAAPIAGTGVVAIIRGEKPGKTVALRSDMDALPIQEETNLPYASEVPGVMHACGHDAHITMLLGAANLLSTHKDELQGNVKLFFQPDEEGAGGALPMIREGCMEDPHVDAVFFGHCTADYSFGSIALRSGPTSASSNPFTVTFTGKGTHGAKPHNGTDVIVAASQVVTALQTICSRRTNPTDSIVISIGSFHAGTASNILPQTAEIRGIMRTLNSETRARAKEDFRQIVTGIAAAMGVQAQIDMRDGYAPTINDEAMTQLVWDSATKLLGNQNVYQLHAPSLGLEDFSYFCQIVPGCYYHIGIANPEKSCNFPLHNPHFAVDPDAIPYGAALYAQIAVDFLDLT